MSEALQCRRMEDQYSAVVEWFLQYIIQSRFTGSIQAYDKELPAQVNYADRLQRGKPGLNHIYFNEICSYK